MVVRCWSHRKPRRLTLIVALSDHWGTEVVLGNRGGFVARTPVGQISIWRNHGYVGSPSLRHIRQLW